MDYEAILALISNNVRTIMAISEENAQLKAELEQLKAAYGMPPAGNGLTPEQAETFDSV